MSAASTAFDGREAERDVGERLGEHAADAHHHAAAELRIGVQPGDELADAGDHVRDEQIDVAVVGARAASSAVDASRTAAASARSRRTRPRSVLWAIPGAVELHHDRVADLLGRGDRLVR